MDDRLRYPHRGCGLIADHGRSCGAAYFRLRLTSLVTTSFLDTRSKHAGHVERRVGLRGKTLWDCAHQARNRTPLSASIGPIPISRAYELSILIIAQWSERSAMDAGIILAAIAGSDPRDPTAAAQPVPDFASASRGGISGLRIGFDPQWNSKDVEPQTQAARAAASDVFSDLGAHMVDIRLTDVSQAVADWVPNCAVEAAAVHEQDFAANKDLYGPILAGVIEMGKSVSQAEYQQILLRRAIFCRDVEALFATVDLILTPVQPFAPLTLAVIATLGEQPDLIARLQRYTAPRYERPSGADFPCRCREGRDADRPSIAGRSAPGIDPAARRSDLPGAYGLVPATPRKWLRARNDHERSPPAPGRLLRMGRCRRDVYTSVAIGTLIGPSLTGFICDASNNCFPAIAPGGSVNTVATPVAIVTNGLARGRSGPRSTGTNA